MRRNTGTRQRSCFPPAARAQSPVQAPKTMKPASLEALEMDILPVASTTLMLQAALKDMDEKG